MMTMEVQNSKRKRKERTESDVAGTDGRTATVQDTYVARAKALGMEEVLGRVVSLVGKGHHVFLATVCKEWQEHYSAAYPSLETSLPSVVESVKRLQWAKECGYELSVGTFKAAAEYGDVIVCEELHRMECPWDEEACKATLRNAKHGLQVLKWLRSGDLPNKQRRPWSGLALGEEAGKCGNVELLEWLLSDEFEGYPNCADMWVGAVKAGRINVLEMLVQHPKVRAQREAAQGYDPWRNGPFWAAHAGNLEVLQWLHANERELCEWDVHVCCSAVYFAKSLSVLQWLRSEEVMCPWDSWACPQVMKDLHGDAWDIAPAALEEMKQWVHTNGRPCECQD